MTTMTETAPDLKTPLRDKVRAYLAGQGYDEATVERARRDWSAVAPGHAAAARALIDAADPRPAVAAPDPTVDCVDWAYATLADPAAPYRLLAVAYGLLNEDDLLGRRFVPPAETEADRRDRRHRFALRAVTAGLASKRPTPCGLGLTPAENDALWEVESAEIRRTGGDFAAARRGRLACFQALMAARTIRAESLGG